jgi:hypothetical protein
VPKAVAETKCGRNGPAVDSRKWSNERLFGPRFDTTVGGKEKGGRKVTSQDERKGGKI